MFDHVRRPQQEVRPSFPVPPSLVKRDIRRSDGQVLPDCRCRFTKKLAVAGMNYRRPCVFAPADYDIVATTNGCTMATDLAGVARFDGVNAQRYLQDIVVRNQVASLPLYARTPVSSNACVAARRKGLFVGAMANGPFPPRP